MTTLNIQTLHLRDYRCFDVIDIDFHPKLTVLIAPNGAGKTSILDAVAVALGPYVGAFDEAIGKHFEPSDIRQFRVRETATHEMEYAPKGVRMKATGHIPGSTINVIADEDAPATWRRALGGPIKAKTTVKDAKELIDYGKRMQEAVRTPGNDATLPLIAYYGTGRLWQQKKLTAGKKIERTSRTIGYTDCLDPASSYKSFVEWFRYWNLNAKDARIKAQESGKATLGTEFEGYIQSVSAAVNLCLLHAGWKDIEYSFTKDALVAHHDEWGELPVELLSDGIRNMIGMVADIAFRATKLNGQLGAHAAVETPGVVLIDEVDMHLHPSWQQTVLSDLSQAFPNLQFIVTTHSPQVLTTVKRENIRRIFRLGDDHWEAGKPALEIKGVDSAAALTDLMHVNTVPPVDEARWLADYMKKIESGSYDDGEGQALRRKLLDLYGAQHPVMLDTDRLIRFQAFKLRANPTRQG